MKNCRGKKGKTEAGWKNIATCLPYSTKGETFERSKQHTKKGKIMRVLIEDMDAVGQHETKVCYSKVAVLRQNIGIFEDWKKAAGPTISESKEFAMVELEFDKVNKQIMRGMLGPGDSVGIDWDGMTFRLSVLATRGKHS